MPSSTLMPTMLTPRMMKLSSLSMLVLLNFVFPEFCMSLVSLPAKMTTPYAHSVFRRTVPKIGPRIEIRRFSP